MKYVILLYVWFAGCIYTSWLCDSKDHWCIKILKLFIGFTHGWYVTPILIGRAIKQIYKEK